MTNMMADGASKSRNKIRTVLDLTNVLFLSRVNRALL